MFFLPSNTLNYRYVQKKKRKEIFFFWEIVSEICKRFQTAIPLDK